MSLCSLENLLKLCSQLVSLTYKLLEYYVLHATCVSQTQFTNRVVAFPDLYISTRLCLISSKVSYYNKAYACSKLITKLHTSYRKSCKKCSSSVHCYLAITRNVCINIQDSFNLLLDDMKKIQRQHYYYNYLSFTCEIIWVAKRCKITLQHSFCIDTGLPEVIKAFQFVHTMTAYDLGQWVIFTNLQKFAIKYNNSLQICDTWLDARH